MMRPKPTVGLSKRDLLSRTCCRGGLAWLRGPLVVHRAGSDRRYSVCGESIEEGGESETGAVVDHFEESRGLGDD